MSDPAADSEETARLLDRAGTGDDHAVEELFRRHRPTVLAFVERRLSPRLRGKLDPSDVVQEAHLHAYRALDDFLARRPMPFRLWLLKATHDRLVDQVRRLTAAKRDADREEPLPDGTSDALARCLVGDGTSPSRRMERAEEARRVRRALDFLGEAEREVLLMHDYEGLAYGEIATLLGITAAAARKRHGRALARLSGLLADSQEGRP
jgi:RNA polymerase sigma-70 factor (ECF subfamily)